MREDFIHYHLRNALRARGWQLIAGQYPNGSDDELPTLRILDPALARDRSPDPRRHSQNKLVPDLVADRKGDLILMEIKPKFSSADEKKLQALLRDRRADLDRALQELVSLRRVKLSAPVSQIRVWPALGYAGPMPDMRYPQTAHFIVINEAGDVRFEGPHEIG